MSENDLCLFEWDWVKTGKLREMKGTNQPVSSTIIRRNTQKPKFLAGAY
jgi:hypothetical protein